MQENHTQIELTASPTGQWINWMEDGELIGVPLEIAEAIAAQIGELRQQLRSNAERQDIAGALRALAGWLESAPPSVGSVYGLDSLSVFFDSNEALTKLALADRLIPEPAPSEFGSASRLMSTVEFGPINVRLVGQPVTAEVQA